METANAFDVLILPMFQWTAAMIASFPILHGIRVGLARLLGPSGRPEASSADATRP